MLHAIKLHATLSFSGTLYYSSASVRKLHVTLFILVVPSEVSPIIFFDIAIIFPTAINIAISFGFAINIAILPPWRNKYCNNFWICNNYCNNRKYCNNYCNNFKYCNSYCNNNIAKYIAINIIMCALIVNYEP